MNRALFLSTAVAFGFLVVIVRLGNLMLLDHERLWAKAQSQYQREKQIDVKRGVIYDRRGRELAVNLDEESLYCDPTEVASPRTAALEISSVTGMKYSDVLEKVSQSGGKKHFVWLKRKLGDDEVLKLKNLAPGGFGFVNETRRYYPNGSLASHVLGFVNVDNKAEGGVERMYESTLTNKGGKVVLERDATGKVLSQGLELESKGNNLVLTIDEGLQYIAETALDEAMRKWRADSASVIMMDPFTGDILAMANRPGYDPNDPGKTGPEGRKNRAIMDLYEPGSTFKIVAGTSAIETGAVSLGSMFDCSKGYIEAGGRKYHDVHKLGVIPFEEIFQKSSNVGAIQVAMRVGAGKYYAYAKKFGFGQKTGIDLPWEAAGRLPDLKRFNGASLPSMAIGYGVAVTPLQILRAYSAVANGGYLVTPHVVAQILSPDGEVISSFHGTRTRILKPETAATFKRIFSLVTEDGGTAKQAAISGNHVSGKTGTSRLFDPRTGRYSGLYSSSFVGFVPEHNPRIAMIVVFKGAKGEVYGGVVAGPVFSEIAEKAFAYMNVPRDDAFKNNLVYLGDENQNGVKGAPQWSRN
ncbi:MAG: penicillin-binding protein 2 [Nitrospiraceae bacterium]|nr:penicillin-binding protein 2 [Nitrospiraceae bacterium]